MARGFDSALRMVMTGMLAAACAPSTQTPNAGPDAAPAAARQVPAVDTLAPDVLVRHLGGRVWLHETRKDNIPSNGLIVETGDGGSLLIDTAWDDEQTGRLVRWAAETLGKPVRRAVSTHFHDDRLGGIDTLRALGIPLRALDLTRELAAGRGITPPEVLLTAAARVYADPDGFEVFYPGAGHSRDNVVVWLPRERLLFGGCLVKAAAARDMGNTADADMANWDDAVAAVEARYPQAQTVVPGHGAPGGTNLLVYTRELLSGVR